MSIAAYPKHESFKPSGFSWIGDIPASWNVRRGKWLFKKMDRPVRPQDDIVTCFRDGVVTLRANRRTEGFTNALKEHGYQGIRKDDLVIHAMDAFAGAVGVSDSNGKSTPVYSACVPRVDSTVNPHFYAYYMRHIALSGLLIAMAKGIRERSTDFRFNDFADLALAAPPVEEQTAIVAFLDNKCAKIDEAVRIKEAQIKLLRERRQILIQQAVTRGLNPDAPMKDSGIDWIGEIPLHWHVKRLRHATQISPSRRVDGNMGRNDHVVFLPMEAVGTNGGVRETFICSSKEVSEGFTYFQRGDVIMAKITPCFENGKGAFLEGLLSEYGFGTTELHVLRPKEITGKFLYYFISRSDFRKRGEVFMVGSAGQKRVSTGYLKDQPISVPPINEQKAIVSFLDNAGGKIDKAISIKQEQISKLKEYKTSLINAAVTGKIKVS